MGVLSHLKWHDTSKLEKWKWKLDLLKIRRPKPISWGKVRWTIQSVSTTHQTSQKWYNQATHNKSTYAFPPSSFHPVFWRIFFSGLFIFTKVRSSQTRQQKGVCHSWSSLKPATSSTIRESLDFCFPTKKDRREFLNCSLRKPPFPSDHPFQNVPEKKTTRENLLQYIVKTHHGSTDGRSHLLWRGPGESGRTATWGMSNHQDDIPTCLSGWWLNQPTWKILVQIGIFPKIGK